MAIDVCLAGATGWAGSELARSIAKTDDLRSRGRWRASMPAGAGRRSGRAATHRPYFASAAEALAHPCDVFVEYTKPDSAKANILTALERGAHVVVGTSGLTESDFAQIDDAARRRQRGVLACGNFALTVVLLQKFAEAAAASSRNGRSSTTRTTTRSTRQAVPPANSAFRLSKVRSPEPTFRLASTVGPREARGATRLGLPGPFPPPAWLRDQAPRSSSACRISG